MDSTVQCLLMEGKTPVEDNDVKQKLPTFLKPPSAGSRKASNASSSGRNSPADKVAGSHVIELDVAVIQNCSTHHRHNIWEDAL